MTTKPWNKSRPGFITYRQQVELQCSTPDCVRLICHVATFDLRADMTVKMRLPRLSDLSEPGWAINRFVPGIIRSPGGGDKPAQVWLYCPDCAPQQQPAPPPSE